MDQTLLEQLFTTGAMEFAPADQPFWYTSGMLGPFYINTQYLLGGKETADQFLELIEQAAHTPERLVELLMPRMIDELETNSDFLALMNQAADRIRHLEFDIISGGERRDFFFSLPLSHLLRKDHLSIMKDGSTFLTSGETTVANPDLSGKTVLHVADIVTQASSFTRQWIPSIRKLGGTIKLAFAILDRCQGGSVALSEQTVELITLGQIDRAFLDLAKHSNRLNQSECQTIQTFLDDPTKYMDDFLAGHPEFIDNEIKRGGKTRERAELAIRSGFVK